MKEKNKKKSQKIPQLKPLTIVGVTLAVLGGALIFDGYKYALESKQSSQWNAVRGLIVKSSLQATRRNRPFIGDEEMMPRQEEDYFFYKAEVVYNYEVNGTTFSGKRISFGSIPNSAEYAKKIVNKYLKNQEVVVYYLPGNPEKAVLEPGFRNATLNILGAGLTLSCFGIAICFYKEKPKHRRLKNLNKN